MGGTTTGVNFTFVVADSEHWTEEHRQACHESDAGAYDTWVCARVNEVAEAAIKTYMETNPDLFKYDWLV